MYRPIRTIKNPPPKLKLHAPTLPEIVLTTPNKPQILCPQPPEN